MQLTEKVENLYGFMQTRLQKERNLVIPKVDGKDRLKQNSILNNPSEFGT